MPLRKQKGGKKVGLGDIEGIETKITPILQNPAEAASVSFTKSYK